ncbi:DMT family transporter [Salipiger abyssi]|uniref:DMT family transporter n=1 Tax=Salipiger abyssi TaxID=1250539 RepID=UPI001A8CAE14|nr:DMT family transporter [Salipiger abyssi]MBN9888009.1 DMT family transporter [Salipiger abyssi]
MSEGSGTVIRGLGWALVAVTVWSGSLVMLRFGVTTSLNAYDLTMLRFAVAALILAPVALRRGSGSDRLGWAGLLGMVLSFGAPYVLLIALAMQTAPAVAAGALNPGVMAIVSVLLGRLVLGSRVEGIRWAGLAATGAGIFVVVAGAGDALTPGHAILAVTGVFWAVYALIVRRAAVPALNATALVATGSALLFLPIYVLGLPKQVFAAPLADIAVQAGFQGVFVSIVAIYAFNRSAELLGAVAAATLPALIPVLTLGFGTVLLGEPVSGVELGAAALITLGLVLILAGAPAARWLSRRRTPKACCMPGGAASGGN